MSRALSALRAVLLVATMLAQATAPSGPLGAQGWCEHDWQERARENCP